MSQSSIRVLYLSHGYAVGGAEEMVLNLVRHLPPQYEPAVIAIHEPGPIGEEIQRTGVPFKALGLKPGTLRPFDLLRLRDFLQECEPQIVHTFLLTGSLYGRFAAMMARVPVVIGTEVNVYERKRPWHVLAERWLMRGTDAVIASAESVREFYIKQINADPAKVEVIYNAVDWSRLETTISREDMRRAMDVPVDGPLLGIIARLTEQKGHRVLLDALAQRPDLSRAHLVIVGDGPLSAALQRQAAGLGIADRVRFLGARRDLGNLLSAIDVFVMPSFWEGLPLAMVLAMGAGLPVVATRVAGIPEVVQDGVNGLLVTPGESGELGAALSRVVNDDTTRVLLGQAARAFVRPRFGIDGYVNAITGVYHRLLAAKGLV